MDTRITRRDALGRLGLLLGGALSASTVAGILAGCRAERATGGYTFRALDQPQQDLLGTLVDLIIPDTDTPGARAAGVPEFIDTILADWMHDEERETFLTELADVDARAETAHGAPFLRLPADRQVAILTMLDGESYTEARHFGAPDTFFGRLKDLTIVGYYTSEIGATQELQWLPVPGRYEPDTPLADVGRTWAE